MLTNRGALLARLHEATPGLASKATIEQSDCFVFKNGRLTTFNDTIMVRVESPLDFDVVVNAADFMGMVSKCPDEEVTVWLHEGELRIKGNMKKAGISCSQDVALPLDAVPTPDKWHRLGEGTLGLLQQAARTCSDDDTQFLATCVHVTPDRIEASDNYRLFRVDGATGFPVEVLIPAESIEAIEGMEVVRVAVGEGWAYFKTSSGAEIAVRCSHEKYNDKVDEALAMHNPQEITLPANLAEMVERAEVFNTAQYDAKVGVRIAEGELTLTSRKDNGWYKERKKIEYSGRTLDFEINPKFLVDILARTREVLVDDRKMKIASDRVQFVVALTARGGPTNEDAEPPPQRKPGKAARKEYENRKFTEADIPF